MQYEQYLKYHNKRADYIPYTKPFFKKDVETLKPLFKGKIYIIKPENGTFRNGITIVSNYSQLYNWIHRYTEEKWIIQEFIVNPLLFNNRKFHLRIYAILIRNKDYFEAYTYLNGFMYSAKNHYNHNDLLDPDSNLSGEGSPKQVNIFPSDYIQEYGISKYEDTRVQINKIVKESIEASIDHLQCPNMENPDYNCFKLIGYDMLVDTNFKVHMLEINARLVTFKYPPDNYKKMMYNDILNLVFKKNTENFDKVLNVELKDNVNEHFIPSNMENLLTEESLIHKDKLKYYIIVLIVLLILSFLMKYLIMFVIILIGIIIYKKYYSNKEEFTNKRSKYIPKYIFQIWISEDNKPVPKKYLDYIKSVKSVNKNFEYKLYKKEDCENFLKNNYPQYYITYQKLPLLIQKIDFIRYIIAYHYGGFYLDLDIECHKNFSPLIIYENVFGLDSLINQKLKDEEFKNINAKYLLSNYAFGCKPKSELMYNIIKGIDENIYKIKKSKNLSNSYVYKTTGPIYITKVYYKFKKKNSVMILKYNRGQHFGQYATHKFSGDWKHEIPKVIIQTYYDKNKIPTKVYKNIQKYCQKYKHLVYDDNDCIKFLKENYSNEVVNKFKSLKRGAHKADLFRYCYLYKNGGIYLDIKTELITNMDNIISNKYNLYTVLSKNKNSVYQGIIMTYKNNELFKDLIDHIVKTPQNVIDKRYLIFTRYMYHKLLDYTNQQVITQGSNNNNVYLFMENCNNQVCYDGKDRYGYCCYVYDNDRKVFKTRYADFPWN